MRSQPNSKSVVLFLSISLLGMLMVVIVSAEQLSAAPGSPAPQGISDETAGRSRDVKVEKEKATREGTPLVATITAVGGIIVAIIGVVSAFFSERRTHDKELEITRLTGELARRKDLELAHENFLNALNTEYDTALRSERVAEYRKLWELMINLPKYPRPVELSIEGLECLAMECRKWYFAGGGLFLSEEARERYFNLQDGCKIILEKSCKGWPSDSDETPSEDFLRKHLDRQDNWKPPMAIVNLAGHRFEKQDFLPGKVTEELRRLGSSLRTALTDDVLTRRTSQVKVAQGATC